MISLRQIRSFVAVYEEGSFTSAARREAATQSGRPTGRMSGKRMSESLAISPLENWIALPHCKLDTR